VKAERGLAPLLPELRRIDGWDLASADPVSISEQPDIKQAATLTLEVFGKA